MRALLVTHYYPAHGGGIERVAAELATRLGAGGRWQIAWMASDADRAPTGLGQAIVCLPANSWNGVERRFGVPWPVWSLSALRKLWHEVGEADVVHLHDVLYFGNVCAWLFARMQGVPLVVTQHVGDVPFRSPLLRHIQSLANRTVGRVIMQSADQAVFISPAVRDSFMSYCRFRASPVYCPNGVDTTTFTPAGALTIDPVIAEARQRGTPVLLFVGRFVEKKGIDILRQLAKALPDVLWVFAGHGPLDPAKWRLHNVHLVRGQSGAGLARYYRAADLLILPSIGEGFPLVVQEAMACGTPAMVGSETAAGCPEAWPYMIVEELGTGSTAERWARRLAELVDQPEYLRSLRASAAGFAHDRWSWEKTGQVYMALYESLTASRALR